MPPLYMATALTTISFFNNVLNDNRQAKRDVLFPSSLLTRGEGAGILPNSSIIKDSQVDAITFFSLSEEITKLGKGKDAACHFALCAWEQYQRESPGDEDKKRVLVEKMAIISKTPTYRAVMMVAYAALRCRGPLPPYSITVFTRVSTSIMYDARVLELLIVALDKMIAEGVILTSTLVLETAWSVLLHNPQVAEIIGHRLEGGKLMYEIRREKLDDDEDVTVLLANRKRDADAHKANLKQAKATGSGGTYFSSRRPTYDWVPSDCLQGEANQRKVLIYHEDLRQMCGVIVGPSVALTGDEGDIRFWKDKVAVLEKEMDEHTTKRRRFNFEVEQRFTDGFLSPGSLVNCREVMKTSRQIAVSTTPIAALHSRY
jgi:hypothetical protein